jgi:uncharacterized protein (TIGR03382 family)
MKLSQFILAALSVSSIASANAAVVYNTSVQHWTVGSGQTNDHFVTNTAPISAGNFSGSAELGLRAQTRFVGSVTPDGGSSNVYTVGAGNTGSTIAPRALWNLDFSANFNQGGLSPTQLTAFLVSGHPGVDLTLTMMMNDGDPTVTKVVDLLNATPFTPTFYGGIGSAFDLNASYTQERNSENLGFGYMFGSAFNPANEHWVYARLQLSVAGNDPIAVDACFHTAEADRSCGGKVPLPGSLALLGLGVASLLARRKSV